MDSGLLLPRLRSSSCGLPGCGGRLARFLSRLFHSRLQGWEPGSGTELGLRTGGDGGLLRSLLLSPSSTGVGSSFATTSSPPYLIGSIGLLCLSLIDHLCRMFLYMCCSLIFDEDLPDRGWICLMARSDSSYLLSDRTLQLGSLHVWVLGRTFVRPVARMLFRTVRAAYCRIL
jgi:hypothetical protein